MGLHSNQYVSSNGNNPIQPIQHAKIDLYRYETAKHLKVHNLTMFALQQCCQHHSLRFQLDLITYISAVFPAVKWDVSKFCTLNLIWLYVYIVAGSCQPDHTQYIDRSYYIDSYYVIEKFVITANSKTLPEESKLW